MKISTLDSPFAFSLSSEFGDISINEYGENISVFLQEQKKDKDKVFHWPGEYEMGGIAIFLQKVGGRSALGKIFVEHIRTVFFTDEDLSTLENTDTLKEAFGNTDILIFKKGENGLSESQIKKLIDDIDPQVLVATGIETKELFKKMSLPLIAKDTLSFTKKSLPQEHTEYFAI